MAHAVDIAHAEHPPALGRQLLQGLVDDPAQVGRFGIALRISRLALQKCHAAVVDGREQRKPLLAPFGRAQQVDGASEDGTIAIALYLLAPLHLCVAFPQLHKYVLHYVLSIGIRADNAASIEEERGIETSEKAVKLQLTFHSVCDDSTWRDARERSRGAAATHSRGRASLMMQK